MLSTKSAFKNINNDKTEHSSKMQGSYPASAKLLLDK